MVIPTSVESLREHVTSAIDLVLTKGVPSTTTLMVYFMFFFVQIALASFMPGIMMEGLPTAPKGVRLKYLCNGYSCYYFCTIVVLIMHYKELYPLTYLIDHYGEVLMASMIIGDVTSLGWYIYGLFFADEYNGRAALTGNVIYDFLWEVYYTPALELLISRWLQNAVGHGLLCF